MELGQCHNPPCSAPAVEQILCASCRAGLTDGQRLKLHAITRGLKFQDGAARSEAEIAALGFLSQQRVMARLFLAWRRPLLAAALARARDRIIPPPEEQEVVA